jgi:hypothetical protein
MAAAPVVIPVPPAPQAAPPPAPAPAPAPIDYDDDRRFKLALYTLTGFFAYITLISLYPVKLPGDTAGIILGMVGGLALGQSNYWFQSSSGSTAKSKLLAEKQP